MFQDDAAFGIELLSEQESRQVFGGGYVKIGDWNGDDTNLRYEDDSKGGGHAETEFKVEKGR